MFVDASVVVAILNREAGFEAHIRKIEECRGRLYFSPLVLFEATAAVARSRSGKRRPDQQQFVLASQVVRNFFNAINASEITITPTIGERAIAVAGRYGKFVGHEADLNFGDCYAYACASAYNVPLLYQGDDFSKTDLA